MGATAPTRDTQGAASLALSVSLYLVYEQRIFPAARVHQRAPLAVASCIISPAIVKPNMAVMCERLPLI